MSGDFLNNLYLTGGLFVAMTTVTGVFIVLLWRTIQQIAGDIRRDIRRLEKSGRRSEKSVRMDIRRLDKRLSGEIEKTNQEIRKANESVRGLQLDMQVVKDRLNIGTVSRPVVPAPVASDPVGASAVSSVPAAGDPAPELPDAGSVGSDPVASDPEADVGSGAVAHRRGRAGVVPPGISATPAAAEQ